MFYKVKEQLNIMLLVGDRLKMFVLGEWEEGGNQWMCSKSSTQVV